MTKFIVVVGMGFGDEGKGSVVDYLARKYDAKLVVRFNGGAQAGHRVVVDDGREHVFSQLGSGTYAGAKTYLSETVVVNPSTFLVEKEWFEFNSNQRINPSDVIVNVSALITTSYHMAINRAKEIFRGSNRHGSCGMGVWETLETSDLFEYVLRSRDLFEASDTFLLDRLQELKYWYKDTYPDLFYSTDYEIQKALAPFDRSYQSIITDFRKWSAVCTLGNRKGLSKSVSENDVVIFEGAQGILLDPVNGFPPYVTATDSTAQYAIDLITKVWPETKREDIFVLGVTRSYMTRHGAGPFVTETADLKFPVDKNDHNQWQGTLRFGYADLAALSYAYYVGKIDEIAITHLDQYTSEMPVAHMYEKSADLKLLQSVLVHRTMAMFKAKPLYTQMSKIEYINSVRRLAPVFLESYGPTAKSKQLFEN